MPQIPSQEVEAILDQWLLNVKENSKIIDANEVADSLHKLIAEGKIYSQVEIKKLVEDYGKKPCCQKSIR